MSTKRWLTVLLVTVAAFGLPLAAAQADHCLSVPAAEGFFTLVALPDTQKYTNRFNEELLHHFEAQTQFIEDSRDKYNIVFVTHVGDVVEDGSQGVEWDEAERIMDQLNGVVPYSVSLGNHDYDDWMVDKFAADEAVNFVERFGSRSWYQGSSPDSRSNYQLFSAGTWTFLHLNLEFEVPGTETSDTLGWARDVLADNPDKPTIITTHSYVRDDIEGRTTTPQRTGVTNPNSGEDIFAKLVTDNPQVFMVLNGHWHEDDGEHRLESVNDAGLQVFEMLANYQARDEGGGGFLRVMQFVPDTDRIKVFTYSPSQDKCEADADSEFVLLADLDERFAFNGPPTAEDDAYTVTEGEELVVSKPGVLGNDSDPDGDGLTATLITGPLDGSVQLNADGSFTYAHAGGTTATDIFTYRASDGTEVSNDATVTITVNGSNDDDGGGTSTFTDIGGHVFEDDIIWLADRGITKGCNPPTNDLFCPDDLVTRGQMAAFLNRALNLPSTSQDFFTDDNGSVFEGDINRLAAAGITKGCNPPANDQFCPTDRVTRGQMASFLVRALGLTQGGSTDFFSDDNGNTHEEDINRLATADITRGCAHDLFCPKDFVSRGQMAAFLHRGLG